MADEQEVKSDDEALAEILGTEAPPAEKPVETEKPTKPRGEDGKFTKKEPEQPKETPQPAVPEGVNPKDYATAHEALKRANAPEDVLSKMDPKSLVDWGLRTAAHQKEVDGYATRMKELEAQVEEPVEVSEIDWSEMTAGLKDSIFDNPEDAMTKFGQALVEKIEGKYAAKDKARQKAQKEIVDRLRDSERAAARTSSDPRYGLDREDRWQQVTDALSKDKNTYSSEAEAVEQTCLRLYAKEIIEDLGSRVDVEHDKRAAGQPTPPTEQAQPASLSFQDREDKALSFILDERLSREEGVRKAAKVMGTVPDSGLPETLNQTG
jgi:hypothetical protein